MSGFALSQFFFFVVGRIRLMFANVQFARFALISTLKLLIVGHQDARIISAATAGAMGPAALWVGAELRANF